MDAASMAWAGLGASGTLGLMLALGRRSGLSSPDHALLLGNLVAPGQSVAPLHGLLLLQLRGFLLAACLAWIWRLTDLSPGPLQGGLLGGILGLHLGLLQRPAFMLARWLEPAATRPMVEAAELLEGPDGLVERGWRLLAQMLAGAACGAFLGLPVTPGLVATAMVLALVGGASTLRAARKPSRAQVGAVVFLREDPLDREALLRWSGESPASGNPGE